VFFVLILGFFSRHRPAPAQDALPAPQGGR
jgi:hypothetical protein